MSARFDREERSEGLQLVTSGLTRTAGTFREKPCRRRRGFLLLYESSGRTIRGRTLPGAAVTAATGKVRPLAPPQTIEIARAEFHTRRESLGTLGKVRPPKHDSTRDQGKAGKTGSTSATC